MAISKGHLKFTGRMGNLVYYYVGKEIYVRTIFGEQRKRVMKDKRYELFRLYGTFFSQSSKIGSFVYKALGLKRDQQMYNRLVGEAQKFFRHTGMSGQQILEVMVEKYVNGVEIEVPMNNEDGGRINRLFAKRKKEESEGKEMKIKPVEVKVAFKNNDEAQICVKEESVATSTVRGEGVVVSKEQVARVAQKRLRITKADVKVTWMERSVLVEKASVKGVPLAHFEV